MENPKQNGRPGIYIEPVSFPFTLEDVAARAFECWLERGCPIGSPEVDWAQAELDLRARSRASKASAASI